MDDWFAFRPDQDRAEPPLAMDEWLDPPAGRHGFLKLDGGRFAFEDGTPVKFWGTNICNARVAPDRQSAERWPEFLAGYGVNAVRFHKFTWAGEGEGLGSPEDSTRLVPEMLDRMDYFVARLRERGIYTGWSHIYGHRPQPGDRNKLLAYDEVQEAGDAHLKGSTIGLVHFAPDLQDLSIQLTTNLLEHENPYTGLRYADDPALAYIELQNEDDIFFPTTMKWVDQCPTYRKLLCEMFSEWLHGKYGDHDGLAEAWGKKGLNAFRDHQPENERLDERNVYAAANGWQLDPEGFHQLDPGLQRRLMDTARFLYERQVAFYGRYAGAIRQTGYGGALVGSCWQTGGTIPHYYNLHNDYLIGHIDRHNYFGGSGGHTLRPGPVNTAAMLESPGSGLLCTGMQMVADRPFAISEWMSLIPNEWVAEGPSIIAVYGLGLQGWDASFSFATDRVGFTDTVQSHGIYNATSPTHMGLYPALARMVYRGDVAEGEVVSRRKVHVPSLAEGRLGFTERIDQAGDVKGFRSIVPQQALAVGRVAVEFTDEFERTEPPSLDEHLEAGDGLVRSTTGQLAWRYGERGWFSVDTPGTQAVVGFAGGRRVELADVVLEPQNEFACLFVTSLDRERPIAEAQALLVTAVARARNTGMVYSDDGTELIEAGEAPIRIEPVRARITIRGRGTPQVTALDHVGRRTEHALPVETAAGDAAFTIGEQEFGTLYYEVRFE